MAAPPRPLQLHSPSTFGAERQGALLLHPALLDQVSALVVCRAAARLAYVETTLAKLGYATVSAGDAAAVRGALDEGGVDVIVADAELLCDIRAALRDVGAADEIGLVALGPPRVAAAGARDQGALSHVGVPVDRGELAWALDRALMDDFGAKDPVPTSRLAMPFRSASG